MDTGRAGSIGAINLDQKLGLSFFAKHNLLPRASYRAGSPHEWPAPTYTQLGVGGGYTINKNVMYTSGSNGAGIVLGWNTGADYNKALFICGVRRPTRHDQWLAFSESQVTGTLLEGPKSVFLACSGFAQNFSRGTIPASSSIFGQTNFGAFEGNHLPSGGVIGPWPPAQLAVYYSVPDAVLKSFIRYETGEWWELGSDSTAHLSKIRSVTLLSRAEVHPFIYDGPIGIFAGN